MFPSRVIGNPFSHGTARSSPLPERDKPRGHMASPAPKHAVRPRAQTRAPDKRPTGDELAHTAATPSWCFATNESLVYAPPMPSPLVESVARIIHAALPSEAGLDLDAVAALLSPARKPELGDFAFPCFQLAKPLRQAPPQIAKALATAISSGEMAPVTSAEATGPYVNVTTDLGAAAKAVLPIWARGEAPSFPSTDTKVMVEYSQPNTHKAFHVGHMRNLCLGDSLVRVLRATGHEVVAANYLGDVGAHIARCLWFFLDHLSDEERQPPATGRGEWLGQIYSRATEHLSALEADAKSEDATAVAALATARARTTEILQRLETREAAMTKIWSETRRWSLDEFAEIYAWSDVHFDRLFYESEVDEPGLRVVQEYLDKGIFVESEGSIGIFNEEIKHMPFFMLRKRDGTGLYSTKDLALAKLKFEEYGIDRSIYVVDMRQSDHFRHVFLTLKKMGFAQAELCEHVPYEMVELPNGPIATRTGNVVLFRQLREQLHDTLEREYFAKYRGEWTDEEIDTSIHQVALGAIKYGMLARDVNQKIVFDMPQWLRFEGNTGPYLQYVAARTASILRKAEERGLTLTGLTDDQALTRACSGLTEPAERALVLALDQLPDVVEHVSRTLRPSVLCTYLFSLAKTYNRFQIECNVVQSEGATLQGRLLLVTATRQALTFGLGVLGMAAPERM